jgi:branched-chain amino acid transport system substrate-binding protein
MGLFLLHRQRELEHGAERSPANKSGLNAPMLGVEYRAEKFWVGMNHATQNSSNTVNAKATFVGGNLDYGQGKVYAGFHRGNMNGANMATNVQGRDADVKQTSLIASHTLSRRTMLYSTLTKLQNSNGGTLLAGRRGPHHAQRTPGRAKRFRLPGRRPPHRLKPITGETLMRKRIALQLIAACGLVALAWPSYGQQQPLKIANIVELSGVGASAGTSFKNGVELAVKEINAAGGILGRKLETVTFDTQTNPSVAKAMAQKAVAQDVFAIFGPVFSGSIMVSMAESRKAEIPTFTGGEAAGITMQGNPYIFRTSFTQASAMPKVARYITEKAKAKSIAIIFVNNDFGKGGLDMFKKALEKTGTRVAAEISTEPGQVDFSAAVLKAKQSEVDAVFVYTNEEESARALRELRKQGWSKPIIGESTLVGQKVIELAGEAANGAVAHVGLTVDAPIPAIRAFRAKFDKEYKYTSDHNGMKGYSGMYVLMAAIEKVGKFDRKAVAAALHGIKVNPDRYPGVLMYTELDNNGDVDRMSFMVEVRAGKQEVIDLLPTLNLETQSVPLSAPASAAVAAPVASGSKVPARK